MTAHQPTILIIEDEPSIADSLEFVLQQEHFQTHWCQEGQQGLQWLSHAIADLVILDVGLPDISGFEVCKALRKTHETPIIFLTARNQEIDRIVGFEIGADDYVVKPFSPREVLARVKAILKRTAPMPSNGTLEGDNRNITDFQWNKETHTIHYVKKPLTLTKSEYLVLSTLLDNAGSTLSRDDLLRSLGVSLDAQYERTVDTHIKSLRAKLRAIEPNQECIQTVRGFGYRLAC